MNRGNEQATAQFTGHREFLLAFLGGGAAANGTVPANGVLTDTAAGLFPKGINQGVSLTYVSTGLYTAVYREMCKHLLFADAIVVDDGASPTAALKAVVTKLTPATKTITVKVYTPAGVLTDLGTSDLLVIKATLADTSVYP